MELQISYTRHNSRCFRLQTNFPFTSAIIRCLGCSGVVLEYSRSAFHILGLVASKLYCVSEAGSEDEEDEEEEECLQIDAEAGTTVQLLYRECGQALWSQPEHQYNSNKQQRHFGLRPLGQRQRNPQLAQKICISLPHKITRQVDTLASL